MIFLDTETCGLTGPIVLIQYAEDQDFVTLHNVFEHPVQDTIKLILRFSHEIICGFNLTFDWFHINKLYNLLVHVENKSKPPDISELRDLHLFLKQNSECIVCVKPAGALDLMLLLRRGPWQTLMGRDDIYIKKIPSELAPVLARLLKEKLPLPGIYFARRAEGYQWETIVDKYDPNFSNIVLRWGTYGGLKPICSEIFKTNIIDYPIPKDMYPEEENYDPYGIKWFNKINEHIKLWRWSKNARSYAEQDVILLQKLYNHLAEPECNDVDSLLACAVGAARAKGFNIDLESLIQQLKETETIIDKAPINANSHSDVLKYLRKAAHPIEENLIPNTTAITLDILIKLNTPLSIVAQEVKTLRQTIKKRDILLKLAKAGRFYPEFKIIGTRSGRMSGGGEDKSKGGSINPQGIQRDPAMRKLFLLADPSCEMLSGGDFESFEVCLADAAYNDPQLRKDLQSGKKFHGLFGQSLFNESYDQVIANRDQYHKAKTSAFGFLYGAMPPKIAQAAGISLEQAELSYEELIVRYPKIGEERKKVFDLFCSVRQPGGIGSMVEWHEPAEYIESLLGFRRYFTLENLIVKTLFEIAQNPPDNFNISGMVYRRRKEQTKKGAALSAIYSAVFQLQAANMRAAANHKIQATGAEITKRVQGEIWKKQPVGIHPWYVRLINVHDEIMAVHDKELTRDIVWAVQHQVELYRPIVPLIRMDWKTDLTSWGDK